MLNQVTLVGRLARIFAKGTNSNNKHYLMADMAVDRNYKDQKGNYPVDFISISIVGKSADIFDRYERKGMLFSVVGSLHTRDFQDRQGNYHHQSSVDVSQFNFLSSPNNNNQNNGGGYQNNSTRSSGNISQPQPNNNNNNGNGQNRPQNGQGDKNNVDPFSGSKNINLHDSDLPF